MEKTALYYEDFSIGSAYATEHRTILQQDVDFFSTLTQDKNPIHTKPVRIADHPFDKPVVQGMLVASIGVGMISALRLTSGSLVAMLDQRLVYKKPVYVGDTVHVKMEVIDKRETGNPMRGIVVYRYEILNEFGIAVVEGTNTIMVFRRNTRVTDGDEI